MNARLDSKRIAILAFALASSGAAWAQSFSSGSTGADGAFNPTTTQTIVVKPGGVYNYTTVNIPVNVTVTYVAGADNAPLVILASGDVNISGTINVPGINGNAPTISPGPTIGAPGGPGAFRGGNGGHPNGLPGTPGHGPGGGAVSTGGGGAGASYGAPTVFGLTPLFGGSGGGGGQTISGVSAGSGAGGGGAILIASSTRINIVGQIRANGGGAIGGSVGCNSTGMGGAGSGGAIRLVAPTIVGAGNVQALRGTGTCTTATQPGDGRIRMEALSLTGFTGTTQPLPDVVNAPGAVSSVGSPALLNVPTLVISSIGGIAVPASAAASYFTADIQLAPGTANPIPVSLTATNTPVGSPTVITLRLMPQSGTTTNIVIPSTDHTGTFASSSATVPVTLPVGQVSVLQAIAAMTLTGQTASLFPLIDGEPVERVMVAAAQGEPSTLSLVTRSGREVRFDQLRAEDRIQVARAWETMRTTRSE